MKILLDFDGVLNTTPTWRPVERLDDGFMAFDSKCADNLNQILQNTNADIVLTTTHRIHYESKTWSQLFGNRGIIISANKVSKVNTAKSFEELGHRCQEIY